MKHLLAPLLAAALIAAPAAHAVEISFGATFNSGFATSDGTDLATGSLVWIGVFDIDSTQIEANAGDAMFLSTVFHQIASASIGQGNPAGAEGGASDPSNAGLFTAAASGLDTTPAGLNVAGQQLYYWVFNASSAGAATQHGIFSSTDWLIPSGTSSSSGVNLDTDISNLTEPTVEFPLGGGQSISSSALIPVGSFGPGFNTTGGGLDFTLADITTAIPEPSEVAMLVGVGALFFAWRRRQRAS